MEGVKQAMATVVKRAVVVADLVAFTAFHFACSAKEFAESGFGVPKLVTDVAGWSVAGCAVAGNACLVLDVMRKFYGKKECNTCNGWEGIRCTSCRGTGKIQYLIVNPGLEGGESSTAESAAKSVVDGRAQLRTTSASADVGYTLPSKDCTTCSGTGVMKCTECNGNAWRPGFHADKLINSSTKALNAYKKLNVPNEAILESCEDPATAEFFLFTRPELEGGYRMDEDMKKEMWWNYEEWRRNRLAQKAVGNQEPGWESMQQVLVTTDPVETLEDPAVVKNVSYYKARRAVEAEVDSMIMPQRPADWKVPLKYPLKESDWSEDDLKDPKKKEERDVLLKAQAEIVNEVSDEAWAAEWRELTIQDLTRQKIENYVKTLSKPKVEPPKPAVAKPVEKAKPVEQMSKEEKKKKERRERAERIAKQAADREAALKKSKARK
ncbi:uncharacterized protein LOC9640114 [Selaginella moellendorffii]|uniref:uncharacterized protein LOC9640114 n=1 Tax=Selaginella moellendorffii TaxID=88036 RepID=UPI000D1C6827|nr:uncharacterized protein LOC9640114 [Selaginella moellendorffii]|eukprot:XP_024515279.1 uncharacterized protein LOC9640114 [Selaginella moellendorffii]